MSFFAKFFTFSLLFCSMLIISGCGNSLDEIRTLENKVINREATATEATKLADIYFYGKGTEPNYEKAYKYYSDAYFKGEDNEVLSKIEFLCDIRALSEEADKGNNEAIIRIGDILINGPEKNKKSMQEHVAALYLDAVKKGSIRAPYKLYRLMRIYNLDFTSKGIGNITKLLNEAAEKGDIDAQYEVGRIYYDKADYQQALKWYTKAAEQDYGIIYNKMARMFEDGRGFVQNLDKAKEYYNLSCKQGYKESCDELNKLRKK